MKKKGFKIEYLLYIYIVISPFLDALSCMYREWFPNASFSPLMVIRPIIPAILTLYIFIKDKKVRWPLIISGVCYVLYGLIHLLIFRKLYTSMAYGSFMQEALYVFNYTYMIYVMFIIMYLAKRKKIPYLKQSLFVMLCCYLGLIYVSILTKTSLPTYVEGTGYRSWFVSGNSLCTVLLLLFSLFVSDIFKEKNIKNVLVFVLLALFLVFLVGTRTGLFGFVLVFIVYILLEVILALKDKIKFDKKKIALIILVLIVVGATLLKVGSKTLERRKEIKAMEDDIVDVNTGEVAHVTGNSLIIVNQIKDGLVSDEQMNKEQKAAYVDLYKKANELKIKSNDYRKQQLIYNLYLVKEQHNPIYILFGNGHVNLYGEMILEMEIPYLLLNFGLLGVLLYLGPLLYWFIKGIKYKDKKYKDVNYYMSIFGLLLGFGLSCIAGYVIYSSTCVLVMICMLCGLRRQGD